MSEHIVFTNEKDDSHHDVVGPQMPAKVHVFLIVDEIGKDGFLVRKSYSDINDPYLKAKNLSGEAVLREVYPEKYNLYPKDPLSTKIIAQHVMGDNITSFISTSSIMPDGSPRFQGKVIYIDIDKAKKHGAKLISTDEIIAALDEYKKTYPHLTKRIDKIAGYVSDVDKEVLIQGKKVPAKAIFTENTLSLTQNIVKIGRVVKVVGIVFTAYDLEKATSKSIEVKSAKPITAEVIRQAGGWGGAVAGAKAGTVLGALCGVETGPGAVITGAIGGVIGGVAGYYGADWVADQIDEN
ncbi:hypothetical protein [Serratia oryzae]|uniref:Glycine zipper family protein n=1 Tax=Serratia oryzae TaxID=2034155 RepID=A0A1S8CD51_9GAMM|nr:hypothetical protein [Serratia oryzae]OMQ18215.1 hypothetical protein BMI79_21985 [Serratia oryzae]VXD08849.1 conserved hypothetical protein [Enterobacterales bacterium 8AC]